MLQKEIRKLYWFNALGNLSIAGAAWVLLLYAQGFSLVQIGIAETVFHLVSITAEIPSGVFADTAGRRTSLILSCLMSILSALIRAFWITFPGVCVSIAFSALSYNFASGADSALAYDLMLEQGQADRYDRYAAQQSVIYRLANGAATLAAGLAVILGNTASQLLSVGLHAVQCLLIFTVRENAVVRERGGSIKEKIAACLRESAAFLRGNAAVLTLIFRNALVGAADTLLLFFLQARLPMRGAADWLLGPLLFFMSMGGVLGARVSEKASRLKTLFPLCLALVAAGVAAAFSGAPWIMALGGFTAAFADDLIQIRTDVALNRLVPPARRATLISVNSLCFSLVMIVLSPLAGWVFSL